MGGEQAGHALIEALDGRGGAIAVLDHKVTESCIRRVEGFKKVLGDYNQDADNKIEIVSELPSGGNRPTGHRATKDILQAHGDLVGIFAINDPSALGAYAALKEDGKVDQVDWDLDFAHYGISYVEWYNAALGIAFELYHTHKWYGCSIGGDYWCFKGDAGGRRGGSRKDTIGGWCRSKTGGAWIQ